MTTPTLKEMLASANKIDTRLSTAKDTAEKHIDRLKKAAKNPTPKAAK